MATLATVNYTVTSDHLPRTARLITDESTITIDGQTYQIPTRTTRRTPGSRIAPLRIVEAIEDAGYRIVGGYRGIANGITVEKV